MLHLKIWEKYYLQKQRKRLDLMSDLNKKIRLAESKGLYKTASTYRDELKTIRERRFGNG